MARERASDFFPPSRDTEELVEQYNTTWCGFIAAEVDLGITFCQIAASSSDPHKIGRNTLHATRAHEAARHFLKAGKLSQAMKRVLEEKIERLEAALNGLRKKERDSKPR